MLYWTEGVALSTLHRCAPECLDNGGCIGTPVLDHFSLTFVSSFFGYFFILVACTLVGPIVALAEVLLSPLHTSLCVVQPAILSDCVACPRLLPDRNLSSCILAAVRVPMRSFLLSILIDDPLPCDSG